MKVLLLAPCVLLLTPKAVGAENRRNDSYSFYGLRWGWTEAQVKKHLESVGFKLDDMRVEDGCSVVGVYLPPVPSCVGDRTLLFHVDKPLLESRLALIFKGMKLIEVRFERGSFIPGNSWCKGRWTSKDEWEEIRQAIHAKYGSEMKPARDGSTVWVSEGCGYMSDHFGYVRLVYRSGMANKLARRLKHDDLNL